MRIASDGQTSTQVWQSTHISLSTFAFSLSIAIADAGHSLTQVSHPVHLSVLTTATNSFTPYTYWPKDKKSISLREGKILKKIKGTPRKILFFSQTEHVIHAIDAGFFADNPPGSLKCPACKD